MIFVTVGTHEQQFNRLIKKVMVLLTNQFLFRQVLAHMNLNIVNGKN